MQKLIHFLIFSLAFLKGYSQSTKYNNSYGIACHNCYDLQFAANIEDIFPFTTAIEIDIWNNEIGSGAVGSILGKKLDQDSYVKHSPLKRGNLNCCGGTFRNCLQRINYTDESMIANRKHTHNKQPYHNLNS